ncbi:MAG: hypothetical protein A2Y15_03245 [Clostridiales bacterium GWF2_36_10]|nr:MAG: hypothetical protein A2Y15_03245 [Clostridiales bacterium GWF2_36_10]HAN20988.1 peptidase [Clostridiales bacterium]
MDGNQSLDDFIYDPDTIQFVIRQNEYFERFLSEIPEVKITQTLSGRYLIGYINKNYVNILFDALGGGIISAFPLVLGLLGRESLEAAGIIQVQEQPFLDLRGSGVLVGIVDTGIDYTNKAFRYEDGTSKIQFLYDQTLRGPHPEGFYVGVEFTKEQIDLALQSENPYDIVPSRDTVGHGTFLASIAAGREDPENTDIIGAAPDAELIVVKLRNAKNYIRDFFLVPPEQENAFESTSLMIGVEYILKKAQQLNRPVAICIGLGTNLGSHDGFTLFEEYLSGVSNISGVCLCLAAGNEVQQRHHTHGLLTETGDEQIIEIDVGENAGNIFIDVLNGASDRISVGVRSPTGELVRRVPAKSGTVHEQRLVLERASVSISYYFPLEGSGGQITTIRIFNATPGVWTILVYGDIILDGIYNSWLPLTGFVSPNVGFLTPTPFHTIVVPATAIGVFACGAYNSVTNSLYERSSWGPTRLPLMTPDITAPGVEVSGVYPTGTGTMTGTSVAAAITAGACALLLQWGIIEENDPAMSTYQARAFIIRGASRDPGLTYPNTQWGYGRLNLIQSFNLLRGQ